MRTKVSAYCDRVIEAGWLLALVVVPLFFNIHSNRVFEPDKLSLLRSIATMMAVAWLIKLSEEGLGERGGSRNSDQPKAQWGVLRSRFVVPTLLLAGVYLLATAVSVVPRVSLWGSYQRLQGTYTMLSYMVVFALMLQNLRRPEQLRRLVTIIILTSLPIALYGLLQHYRLDPLPWGGDVTERVAANMGNPIFVAAYLIMVVPITLARIVHLQESALGEASRRTRASFGALFWALVVAQAVVWALAGYAAGIAASLVTIAVLSLAAAHFGRPMARFVLMGCYGFVLTVQLVSIFYTESRGPWLGLAAGILFFALLHLLSHRRRAVAIAVLGVGAVAGLFLVLINLPRTPLPGFRELPRVGRLAKMFNVEGGTGRVRVLIWEGAAEMIVADPLRTLVGYGPESMWVAYNRYYPPELAHHEARNASPDRSHNETFDAMVITGLLGSCVYMFLWVRVLYYGLRWLGRVRTPAQKRLLMALGTGGAFLGLVVPLVADRSLRFVGVTLPIGFMLGISAYLAASVLGFGGTSDPGQDQQPSLGKWDTLLLTGLVSAVVAHFVEIQFGIAIAATRTYFWAYAALIALLGERLVSGEQIPVAEGAALPARGATSGRSGRSSGSSRRKRKGGKRGAGRRAPTGRLVPETESIRTQLNAITILAGLVLATLAWNHTTNPRADPNPLAVIWSSLTSLAARGEPGQISLGMLWLVMATFVVTLLASLSELVEPESEEREIGWWLRSGGIFAVGASSIGALFALIHAVRLNPGTDLPSMLHEYYLALAFVGVGLASILYRGLTRPTRGSRGGVAVAYPVLILVSLLFVGSQNVSIIKADILYKQGLRFDQAGQWDQAIHYYQKAADETPSEDFFRLFLGRALMEKAKLEEQAGFRDAYYQRGLESLKEARRLNPLNTDHTANMARLYRSWGETDSDPVTRQEKLDRSAEFYEQATQLSPHNAQLFIEWGDLCQIKGDPDQALARYEQALALDREFAKTYFLIGDLQVQRQQWRDAAQAYESALALDPGYARGWSTLAFCYSRLGEWEQAVEANLSALEVNPADYGTLRNLAASYAQLEEWDKAIEASDRALRINPQDYATLKNLALLYKQSDRPADALIYAERALAIAPEGDEKALEDFVLELRAEAGKD